MNLAFPGIVAFPKYFYRALLMRLTYWLEAVQDLTAGSLSNNGLPSNIMNPEGGSPGLSPCFLRKLAGTEAPRSVCHI